MPSRLDDHATSEVRTSMDEEKQYVVGNESNPVVVKRAIDGLRKMVAFGREAEVALAALESVGHYDHLTHWYDEHNKTVKRNRFPRFEKVCVDDMPMLSQLWLEPGRPEKAQYGGHKCVEYPLYLRGEGWVFDSSNESFELKPISQSGSEIGKLRVSKSKMSYLSRYGKSAFHVSEKKSTIEATIKAMKSNAEMEMARIISGHLVRPKSYEVQLNQRAKDLHFFSPKWLVDFGHMRRILEDLVRGVCVADVMNS